MRLLALTAVAAANLLAQSNGSIDTPVLGLVFDRDASAVRLLEGIPGAARLGAQVDASVADAATSSQYAVAIDRGGSAVILSAGGRRPLPGARTGASKSVLSPSGSAAALVFSGEIQVFTGLPEAPQLRRSIEVAGVPAAVAVSDDGDVVLALSRSLRGEDVVHAYTEGGPLVFYRARRVAALAFLPGSRSALIAEPASVKIVRQDLGEEPVGADPGRDIAAVAAAPDGSRVFIASRSGRVTIHDLRTGASTSVACACAPNLLAPLRGGAVFRLNDGGDGPIWLLDAGPAEPRIAFVANGGAR